MEQNNNEKRTLPPAIENFLKKIDDFIENTDSPFWRPITMISKAAALLVIFGLLMSSVSWAENKSECNDEIEIWSSNLLWANGGQFAYVFTIDSMGFIFGCNSQLGTLADITVATNLGAIEFEGEIDGSEATRYLSGYLYSSEDITKLVIRKVSAKNEDGQTLDITNMFTPRDFKPVLIQMGASK